MTEFISSEAATLLSLICKDMPNLLKYIIQFAVTKPPTQPQGQLQIAPLSPKVIQEAREHSSQFLREAIASVAIIQSSLNTASTRLDNIQKQRMRIEKIISTLLHDKK